MVSPTRNGLNNIIKIPPAKLDNEPCKDNPTAKPAATKIATKEEVSTPNFEITVMKSMILKVQKIIFPKKFVNVISTFLLVIIFLAVLVMKLVNHNPPNKISNAIATFGE